MAFHAGVGISHDRNPQVAGREAADAALKAAGIDKPDFVFLFASVGYAQQPLLAAVREATGKARLIGCSGEGVIVQGEADESAFSVAVTAIASDEARFLPAMAGGLKADPAAAGAALAAGIRAGIADDSRALILLADGLTVNFDALAKGLMPALGRPLPLFGGVSADNWVFKQTYQYFDDQVISDGAVAALLSGSVRIATAVNHGCVPLGGRRKVTRSEGNRIFEIDGRPILEVLKEYLVGEEIDSWDKAVINLCLGFKAPGFMQDGYDEYLIRFIPSKDQATRSITIQTEVEQGCDIWMTRRDPAKMDAGIERIGEAVARQLEGKKPKLVFQFDCCGRGKVILRDQQKARMLEKLQRAIGSDSPWIGFYTLGEIGPVGGQNCFHNYTVVLMVIH